MIELLYFASQIQCGANANLLNIQVDVSHNGELIKTLSVNEKALLEVDSIQDLTFEYKTVGNTACSLSNPSELVLSPDDTVPNMAGAYDQESIQDMLDSLNEDEYEELLLVELGTEDENSTYYDLQDVVMKVDNDPTYTPIEVSEEISLFAD